MNTYHDQILVLTTREGGSDTGVLVLWLFNIIASSSSRRSFHFIGSCFPDMASGNPASTAALPLTMDAVQALLQQEREQTALTIQSLVEVGIFS